MQTTLAATLRTGAIGKGVSRKLRAQGEIPAVMYGPDQEATSIAISPKVLEAAFRKSKNRNMIVNIEVDGVQHPTLVRTVQRHPVSRELLHVDFLAVSDARPVVVDVPIAPYGKMVGATLGGQLRVMRRSLTVSCPWNKIPSTLPIDVSPMDIGDLLRSSSVELPEGASLTLKQDVNVVTCFGKKAKIEKKKDEKATGKKKK